MRFRDSLTNVIDAPLPGGGRLALDLADKKTFLLQITTGEDFKPAVSYAVIKNDWEKVRFKSEEPQPGHYLVDAGELKIEVDLCPLRIRVTDKRGEVRFETEKKALRIHGSEVSFRRSLEENEAIYGLGESGHPFNRHPGKFRFWNSDQPMPHPHKQYYCGIPFAICAPVGATLPHAMFLDNPGDVRFDIGLKKTGRFQMTTSTGDFRLWLLFGETPAELLTRYTEITGRMQRPPKWILGYQQCRWSYPTEARVREVASEFRKRRIPCDVIYFDIQYMQKFRVFTWSKKAFPKPEKLLNDLKEQGFDTVCIVDPGVAKSEDYSIFRDLKKKEDFFLRDSKGEYITEVVWPGEVHMPDFTNPRLRERWGEHQAAALLDKGISGIWNDMNEPAIFASDGTCPDFPADAIHYDFGLFRCHKEVHNIYGMTMAQASEEGQRQHRPDARSFTLTRSGWAGIQRHSAVWTGDNQSSFLSMVMDIQLNLSMGMSGVAHVGCDIGGFGGNATPELFARWIEWGVFQPFARGHSSLNTFDHEPWAFGPGVEQLSRRMIELRYELLPYIYTLFVEAAETGLPVNRPLALEYPNDATVASIGDQFLLGRNLLVAPVLEPGKTHRALYLPAGDWYSFWTDEKFRGGRWIMVEAPIGKPPVFVRAGAVLPMAPVQQHTKEPAPEETRLHLYPGRNLDGLLVEDDGASMNYTTGEESRIAFSGKSSNKELRLMIAAPEGNYAPARKTWKVHVHSPQPAKRVLVNGEETPFEASPNMITWTIPDNREAVEVHVELGD